MPLFMFLTVFSFCFKGEWAGKISISYPALFLLLLSDGLSRKIALNLFSINVIISIVWEKRVMHVEEIKAKSRKKWMFYSFWSFYFLLCNITNCWWNSCQLLKLIVANLEPPGSHVYNFISKWWLQGSDYSVSIITM